MKNGGRLALIFLFVGTGVARMIGKDSACGIENVDCIASVSGSAYTGTVSKTRAGVECQAWNDQSPHQHNDGIEMEHNHCRNPDGKPGLWCYTKDSNTTWDFCEVKKCRDCESDLDFEDSTGEKDIVKLKGRCIVRNTAKTVLTGIKTKAECLTACLAKENATGCQYRRVKKRCKVVTGSFQKASYRLGVTCWRFDDVVKNAIEAADFSNMTKTRIFGVHGEQCGPPGWYCPLSYPFCCLNQGVSYPGIAQKCCNIWYPKCGGDTSKWFCYSNVNMSPHPTFEYKHFYEGLHTKEEVEDFCKRRNKKPFKCKTNTVFTGIKDGLDHGAGIGVQFFRGDKWQCGKLDPVSWNCTKQDMQGQHTLFDDKQSAIFNTKNGHYYYDTDC